jgi:hypothetical protein
MSVNRFIRLRNGVQVARNFLWFLLVLTFLATPAVAQDNYEIQVYGSDTVAKGAVMVELHSNYTAKGFVSDNHAFHETLEITRGFNDWFETGFYVFTSARTGDGWQFVGSHIRPRVRVPTQWHWPVGVSLSTEFGWVSSRFSEDTWSWEIRPIIDKELGRWYLSFNPALEKSFHGQNAARGFAFAPAVNIKYDVTPKVAAGIEYYGGLRSPQSHQIFPAIDLNLSPDWEFNAGVGIGLTKSTDKAIIKVIVGRRTRWP